VVKVFLSHASEDRECAGQLHQWLVGEGHEVFLDQDLRDGVPVGEDWGQRLHERLRWADALVCLVSKAAVESTWCTAEVSNALSRGSRVLPVRIELGVDHPLLRLCQYTDLTVDPAVARVRLVEALRRIDAAGAGDGLMIVRRFQGCVRLMSKIIGCFLVAAMKWSTWQGCCGLPLSVPKGQCCWWWARQGVASRL
jgi:hypothetical protein